MKRLIHAEIAAERLSEEQAAQPEGRFPLIAILDNIRSMYNVGSIFRTSDGARIEAIYTVGYTPHPPRKEIEKTALDATRTVPFKHFKTMAEAIADCRSKGMKIAALELTDKSRSIFDIGKGDFPMALVIGNEITGVSDEALALSDEAYSIPMFGAKHSLNVAVAYGVAVFECIRARSK
ncbi:MAG: TrmH family RNA methyltransferase [Bacteroidota bacterium]|nr:TrmH family RNA methyltransferase [Bacteroidota bacterium]MDP4230183.1 TrmH family RNA methyltransferase [Bacteroidota bacterium]MDP4237006.1 TrmH family RNA methyltransferase [Bacteroidota bacterium]